MYLLVLSFLNVSFMFGYFHSVILPNSTYNKYASPFDYDGKTIELLVDATLVILIGVQENVQTASYILFLNYTWIDPRLAYNASEPGAPPYVIIPTSQIWIPMLNCWNCIVVTNFDKNTESDDAYVEPSGQTSVFLRARYDTLCQCDITAFPFDVQFCTINIDPGWSYRDRVVFIPVFNKSKNFLVGTSEWKIAYDRVDMLDGNAGMRVVYKLTRNSAFYFCLMILPTLVITSACLGSLLLPSELTPGERVAMGITGLLGLTFLLSILVAEVPRAEKIPVIGIWLLIEMSMCILALILIYPIKKIKKQVARKGFIVEYGIDLAVFSIVFGANLLTSIFMFLYPGQLSKFVAPFWS